VLPVNPTRLAVALAEDTTAGEPKDPRMVDVAR